MTKAPLRDSARQRLLALGIPEEEHTLGGLSRLFPPLLRPEALPLDLDALAGAFLHFVDRQLISVPGRGEAEKAGVLKAGAHFCQFYRGTEDLLGLLVPYFLQGLGNGEYCVWVVPGSRTVEWGTEVLRSSSPRFSGPMGRGEIVILDRESCYLEPSGEMRPRQEIIEGFMDLARWAFERGFPAMRSSGDKSWLGRTGNPAEYFEYERRVTNAIRGSKITTLCTYLLDAGVEQHLEGIIAEHEESLLKEDLLWHRLKSAYLGRDKITSKLRELAGT